MSLSSILNIPYVKGSKTLNLYDGLGTKSIKGHCYKFLHHLRWIVCKGDKSLSSLFIDIPSA